MHIDREEWHDEAAKSSPRNGRGLGGFWSEWPIPKALDGPGYGKLSGSSFLLPAGYWAVAHVPLCVICALVAYAIARYSGLLKLMTSLSGPRSIETMRPQIEPTLLRYGRTWEEFSKMSTHFTQADVRHLIQAPGKFLEECMGSEAVLRKFSLAKARPILEQQLLQNCQVEWEDVMPLFEGLDDFEELQNAIADPESFMEQVMKEGGVAAKRSQPSACNYSRFQPVLTLDHTATVLIVACCCIAEGRLYKGQCAWRSPALKSRRGWLR